MSSHTSQLFMMTQFFRVGDWLAIFGVAVLAVLFVRVVAWLTRR